MGLKFKTNFFSSTDSAFGRSSFSFDSKKNRKIDFFFFYFSREAQINNTKTIFFSKNFEKKVLLSLLEAHPNSPTTKLPRLIINRFC